MLPTLNGLKKGDAISPLLSNFVLQYVMRRVQVNQGGLIIKWYRSAFGVC
jgi:hypothetical protein